jgi:hypothetical protein
VWAPDVALKAVVCTADAFSALAPAAREQAIAALQSATLDGGVHLVRTLVAGRQALTGRGAPAAVRGLGDLRRARADRRTDLPRAQGAAAGLTRVGPRPSLASPFETGVRARTCRNATMRRSDAGLTAPNRCRTTTYREALRWHQRCLGWWCARVAGPQRSRRCRRRAVRP